MKEEEYIRRLGIVHNIELSQFLDSINIQSLAARASVLCDGVKCRVASDRHALEYGGGNWLVPIDFEDGQHWFARFSRLNGKTPIPSMGRHVLLSEIATYEYLASAGVAVPKVFDYAVDAGDSHGVGWPYLLLERLDGLPLETKPFGYYSEEERAKILPQLARIQIKLAEHPLPAIGSLHMPGTGSPVIGPFSLSQFGHDVDVGPFTSAAEYWTARIGRRMEAILQKKAYSQHTLEAYLAMLYLRERLQVLYPNDYDDGGCFYFRHIDDKGDHIIVDDELNFLGMVDLEYTCVLPKAEAFAAPSCLVDYENWYRPELSPAEKEYASLLRSLGREDLASCAERGRAYRLVEELFRQDYIRDEFRDCAEKLLLISDGVSMTWTEWKEQALVKYADDENLKSLLK